MEPVLTINEIFHSIQGESTHSGRPCVFVRLTACDLRCSWCDTPYAFTEGRKMTVDEVVASVEGYACDLVEITGGEPLLQRDVYPLMDQLLASGKTVLVETGGHLSIKNVPASVIRIMDVKCPGSGESEKNHWENLELLAIARRGEVRDPRPVRLRLRERRRCPSCARRQNGRRAVFAGARCPRSEGSCGVDSRGSAAGQVAAAGPQVHLGCQHSWRLKAVLLLSGGLDSYTAGALCAPGRLRAVRVDGSVRTGARSRGRRGA